MRKTPLQLAVLLLCAVLADQAAHAVVVVTDGKALKQQLKPGIVTPGNGGPILPATGSQSLIDAGGLKYFINTNITFSTTSSASGAVSEASYTHAVNADTQLGGSVSAALNDATDGFNTLCLSLNNTVANCATGNANFVIYNKLGPATLDATCSNRQIIFPVKTSGSIQMQRKVFVPTNDTFLRHVNIFTNTGAVAQTVTAVIANNLGSDSNTKVTGNSANLASPLTTTGISWITSFQNWSGNTSTDPRLGFALQSAGAATTLSGLNFVDGDDNPYWGYTFTLPAGQTKIIANFFSGQPTIALSKTKAAELATGTNVHQWGCMTAAEVAQVANFAPAAAGPAPIPTLSETAMALTFLLLAGMGAYFIKRRDA